MAPSKVVITFVPQNRTWGPCKKRLQNAQLQNEILRSKGFGDTAPNKQTAGNVSVYGPVDKVAKRPILW